MTKLEICVDSFYPCPIRIRIMSLLIKFKCNLIRNPNNFGAITSSKRYVLLIYETSIVNTLKGIAILLVLLSLITVVVN